MAKQCELIIGYLLPRRCEEKGVTTCSQCQRTVCELHTRIGDQGLLCRDCHEEGKPRLSAELPPLPEPVSQAIYHREGFAGREVDDDDFAFFDSDDQGEAFSTLS
jgi:hypothetical protein